MSRRESREIHRARRSYSHTPLPPTREPTSSAFSPSTVSNLLHAIKSNQALMKNGGHVFDMVLRTLGPQYYSLAIVKMVSEWVINNWELIVEFLIIGLEKAVKFLEKKWGKDGSGSSFWVWLCQQFKLGKPKDKHSGGYVEEGSVRGSEYGGRHSRRDIRDWSSQVHGPPPPVYETHYRYEPAHA